MKTFLITLAMLLAAPLSASATTVEPTPEPTVTTPAPKPEVLFIGDSMTSLYNNVVGSTGRGWWSYVAETKGWVPRLSAEYGSGFLREGHNSRYKGTACSGTIFKGRLSALDTYTPDKVFVAGGRNDGRKCSTGTSTVDATSGEAGRAADAYFDALALKTDALGIPRSEVYVLSPWAGDHTNGDLIRPLVRDRAKEHGFTWITTPYLNIAYTTDGVHQDATGNRLIRDWVLDGLS